MLCTVIYSFYQHRGRWGVFVFDSPVLQFSSSFPYWATFNLPSAGLQLNVKHPGGTKTASLDLNISRDPWPHQAPPGPSLSSAAPPTLFYTRNVENSQVRDST